jgi:hypothetical protein
MHRNARKFIWVYSSSAHGRPSRPILRKDSGPAETGLLCYRRPSGRQEPDPRKVFGPIVVVMRASDIDDAIRIADEFGYKPPPSR